MPDAATTEFTAVLENLDELYELVSTNAVQPVNQFAEHAVVYWLRIVDEKDVLLPRLSKGGYVPGAFHFGMERNKGNQIDVETPGQDESASRQAFSMRLEALGEGLEKYFAHSGYRSSSEYCDQVMLEVNRFSRFIAACCSEAEHMANADGRAVTQENHELGGHEPDVLEYTRRNLFTLEPALNDVIVAWEQNALVDFDLSLNKLAELIALDDGERDARRMQPGFPLRPRGRPRRKVAVITPALRPMRTKPMFVARFGQLVRRLEELGGLPAETARGLATEVRFFIAMVRSNQFMLASEPSFWDKHRPGMPLIRGRPSTHPFLHDPMDFFKKAVLFHNRTYTVAGGGVDLFFMQVKQLQRLYNFNTPAGVRIIRPALDQCVRGWEENRWDAFTEGLLQMAETLRQQSEAGEL